MQKIQEKVAEFFASHPDATEVHEALGVLFTDKEKATKYLAGVAGRMVTTHGREGLNFERESDRLRHEIMNQENLVGQKHIEFEATPPAEKQQAMSAWEKESRKLDDLKSRLAKQVELEGKEERIAKSKKEHTGDIVKKEKSKEELEAAISAQEAIVETNEKMIATMTGQKKKKALKAQEDETKLLEQLKDELVKRFPAEEVTEIVTEEVTEVVTEEVTEVVTDNETEK